MDNASKALIMAGGILLAVMVIGVSMYILSSARGLANTSNEQMEKSAIESFNRFYTSFGESGCRVQGIDLLNICSKAADDNARDSSVHQVSIAGGAGIANSLKEPDGVSKMKKLYTYTYTTDSDGYVNSVSFSPV